MESFASTPRPTDTVSPYWPEARAFPDRQQVRATMGEAVMSDVLAQDAAMAPVSVTVDDLLRFAATAADLADPDVMAGAWDWPTS